VNGADVLPTVLGIALVAGAAAFALLPFARRSAVEAEASSEPASTDRSLLYRRVLELEFDVQLGKLTAEDYEHQSRDLLAEAGQALRQERGSLGELDEEIEREIAAARAAFTAARRSGRRARRRPVGSPEVTRPEAEDPSQAARTRP
jgi:hypothetical protein